MKKNKTALIFAMVAVLFSTGCNNPVIQPVIPSEDGIWAM